MMGFPIGLIALSADTQRRVGRDAWLLTAWWIVVGVACSALLLEVVGLRSPLWRYPLTAIVMYAIGRDVLPPEPAGESWPMIVRETWAQGLSFLVLSAAIGATLAVAYPGAVSLRDLLP